MSASNNESWKNGQVGIFTLLLVIFLIWAFAGDRPFFRHRTILQDAGHDLKVTGRDAAASIRDTVQ